MIVIGNNNQQPTSNDMESLRSLHRVLIISHVSDSRYKNGGTVYTRSLLELMKLVSPGVEADLVFFTKQTSPFVGRLRQASALIRAAFSELPSKALYFRSRSFSKMLVSKMRDRAYDLVIFDHAEMLWCLELVPKTTAMLAVAHNIESKIYEQFFVHRPIARRFFCGDLLKYQSFEAERLGRVQNVIAISSEDATTLRASIDGLNVLVVPPTFSYAPAQRSCDPQQPLRLGMLGNFGWWPNRESYEWFLENVWRHVKADIELHIFGAQSDTLQAGPRTKLHGFVDALSEVWHGVDLMINPIVSGSGVNVKVAEAIHNGMPMLCTPMAVAGLLDEPDPAIAVLESAEQWISILEGDGAVLLAKRKPQWRTRSHVDISSHASPFATFLENTILRSGSRNSR